MDRTVLHNMNSMNTVLSDLESRIDGAVGAISDIASKSRETFSYEDIKNGSLIKHHADAVEVYGEVCSILTEASTTLIDLRTFKKQISQMRVSPSFEQQFRNRIDRLVLDLEDLRKAAQAMKDSFDARLRFFTSCQYTLYGNPLKDKS